MRLDLKEKIERLGEHIPAFAGYSAVHHLQADLLLRRFLAGEVEKVRDRLAGFIAAGAFPGELRERLGLSLRSTAFLKAEVTPGTAEVPAEGVIAAADEERLLDFDLALEEKVAALYSLLDALEAAADPAAAGRTLEFYDEGLAEVDDLFRLRRRLLEGAASERR